MKQPAETAGPRPHKNACSAAQIGAAVLAVGLLGILLAFARPNAAPTAVPTDADDDPESCCYRLLSAEQSGDVSAYLDCFTGALQQQLQAQLSAKSPAAQSAGLRDRAVDLTGQATTDLQFPEQGRAELTLERIFTQHRQRQRVELLRTKDGWKIVSIEDRDRVESRIPYGTPVSQEPAAEQ